MNKHNLSHVSLVHSVPVWHSASVKITTDPAGHEYDSHSGLSRWLSVGGRGNALL